MGRVLLPFRDAVALRARIVQKFRIGHRRPGDLHQVIRRGEVPFLRQAVAVVKGAVLQPQLLRLLVHHLREGAQAACDVHPDGVGGIVCRRQHHLPHRHRLALIQPQDAGVQRQV